MGGLVFGEVLGVGVLVEGEGGGRVKLGNGKWEMGEGGDVRAGR